MTPAKKKRLLRYAIAADLVILVTGAGLLFPHVSGTMLIALYTAAVAVSVWKGGGWRGGVLAMLLSLVAAYVAFGRMSLAEAAIFALLGGVICAVAAMARRSAPAALATAGAPAPAQGVPPLAPVVAFEAAAEREAARLQEEKRLAAEKEAARQEAQRKAAAEKEAARLEAERKEVAERETARLKAETKAASERAAAEKAAAEKEAARLEAEKQAAAERAAAAEKAASDQEAARREAEQKLEAERAAAAEKLASEREAARLEAEQKLAAEREAARLEAEQKLAAEREAARLEAAQKVEAERAATAEKLASERETARLEAEQKLASEREAARLEAERKFAAEREAARLEAEQKLAAEREAAMAEAARARQEAEATRRELERVAREAEARLAAERESARVEAERVAAQRLESERAELERRLAERLRVEREQIEREALEKARAAVPPPAPLPTAAPLPIIEPSAPALPRATAPAPPPATPAPAPPPAALASAPAPAPAGKPATAARRPSGLLSRLTGWMRPAPKPAAVNLKSKKIASNRKPPAAPSRQASSPQPRHRSDRKPRLLLLEKRRGTADTVIPKLRQKGIDVEVVERWIDAVDELFRFRPDAFLLDLELPDFDKVYKSVTESAPNLPIFLTGKPGGLPAVRSAGFAARPYDADQLAQLARDVHRDPNGALAQMMLPPKGARPTSRPTPPPATIPIPPAAPPAPVATKFAPIALPAEVAPVVAFTSEAAPQAQSGEGDDYQVICFNCRVAFDAMEADWCSCLTKERTLVCTNCLTCFCKAPPSYKEKFWLTAPPRLFERKSAELRSQLADNGDNPAPEDARRPLVMLVEDDEDIQAIVKRVCNNLGYGFVSANNGQDGLELARVYRPNLILSDAFMPKLDGREMCRILKEESGGNDFKAVVMTGLYTDTKYKSEALKRFHIDDYLSKPVSITDLINLLQKHLEGVSGLPAQEDLHALHRKDVEEAEAAASADDFEGDGTGIALMDLLEATPAGMPDEPMSAIDFDPPPTPAPRSRNDDYPVCCFTCQQTFDATKAEWCTCLGRDQTLACLHCGNCFCKAPAAYRERFWIDAPPTLFERKMIGSKRSLGGRANPAPREVKRPLILLVEDDENIQLIVKTVVTTMGYGFIVGANGQEGLSLAREYNPDLILSDAFMPKLDGREMCRLLKEDPSTARSKAIIMTGLYTDRKYRNEALSYFKVDDYVAKPLAVDDLINLMKKHLPQDVQPTM
jgi:DNA-binding response OmpR family regulator